MVRFWACITLVFEACSNVLRAMQIVILGGAAWLAVDQAYVAWRGLATHELHRGAASGGVVVGFALIALAVAGAVGLVRSAAVSLRDAAYERTVTLDAERLERLRRADAAPVPTARPAPRAPAARPRPVLRNRERARAAVRGVYAAASGRASGE